MSIGTSIQTIDIPAVIDANKVSNFQKWILILVGLTVVMDGFDVQAMGYVAPVIIKEWGVAKSMLGPVFGAHVDDWDIHLEKLCAFWSSLLLRTARYSGAPMPKHVALDGLTPELFERWLALFRQTADEQPNQAMATRACEMAGRIANSLWLGYQMSRDPGTMAVPLAPSRCA